MTRNFKCIPDKCICFWKKNCIVTLRTWTGRKFSFGTLSVPLILVSDHFISSFFIIQLLSMTFCLKLKEKIPLIACFVKKLPKTIIHFFCECEVVKPIWNDIDKIIKNKHDINFASSPFEKMFGIQGDKFIIYFLCV